MREELKGKGALARDEHQFKVLIQRQEMTGAERRWLAANRSPEARRWNLLTTLTVDRLASGG